MADINAPFWSAFVSSLAGAVVGAGAAMLHSRNSNIRKDRVQSLRNANNAMVLAWSCAEVGMALKQQHVRPLVREFRKQQEEAERVREFALLHRTSGVHEVTMEMNKFSPVTIPIEALKNFVYTMTLTDSRSLSAVSKIESVLAELNHALAMRTELIDEFRGAGLDDEAYMIRYLGLFKEDDGSVDNLYASTMEAMAQYTDDLIFFSVFLVNNLQRHAEALRDSLDSWRVPRIPKIEIDMSPARVTGLVPEDEQYESWLRGFRGD